MSGIEPAASHLQRIDLRDNCVKLAGLMALALSLKVNTSVTQLDLDDVPKKKMEDNKTLEQYLTLVAEIREYCMRNEMAAREEEDTVEEGPTTGTPGRGRMTSSTSRKISLTCETLLHSAAVPPQPTIPDSGLLSEPRRGSSGRLRSPAPSPVPSPVSSPVPSPSRTRFQVSRVAESTPFLGTGQSGSPTSTSSSPITPPSLSSSPSRFFPSLTSSRFRVTLVEPSAPPPTVTSPSGNVTVGFTFKKNDADSTNEPHPELPSDSAPEIQVVSSSDTKAAETRPGIAVTSSSVQSQSSSLVTQQAPLSQNVKVTVKLDPNSDSLVIENEASSSVASDISEDTDDMEVRSIMDPCNLEGSSWVSCNVQDSFVLRRGTREMPVSPDKEVPAPFPFPNISDNETVVLQSNADRNMCVTVQSSEDPIGQNSVTSTVKPNEKVDNNLCSMKLVEHVHNSSGIKKPDEHVSDGFKSGDQVDSRSSTMKPCENVDNSLIALGLDEWVNSLNDVKPNKEIDNGLDTVKPDEQADSSLSTVKQDKQVDNGLSIVKQDEQVTSGSGTMKPDEQVVKSDAKVDNNLKPPNLDAQVDNSSKHVAGSLESSLKQPEQVEHDVKQMPPHRTRKISWIAPTEPEEPKATSGLERLLGLFHNPGSFFNKSQQQHRTMAAIVNPQPVANSNTSFLLAAGPLGSIANGGSGLISSGSHIQTQSSPELLRDCLSSQTATKEVKTSVKQDCGMLRKETKPSNCENPIPDIINNNNKVQEIMVLSSSNNGSGEDDSELEDKGESECSTRHCEDENYNVAKLYEAVIKTKVCEDNADKSLSEAVTFRNFEVGITAEVKETCDSICNFSTEGSQNTDTLGKDIGTGLESLKLVGSSDGILDTSQCTAEESGTEFSTELGAIKSSPTNGINNKPLPCSKRDSDQFCVDFANESATNSGLSNDKSWSRSCDASFSSLQSAASTVRLVGSASEFSSYEMDIQKGDGACSLLLSDHSVDASAQPDGKEVEMLQSLELRPSNTI